MKRRCLALHLIVGANATMLRTTQRIRLALLEVMDLIGVHAPRLLAPLVNPSPALAASLRTELREQLAISEQAG
jgi:hypothetical protein